VGLPVNVSKCTVSKTERFDNSISGNDLAKVYEQMIKNVHYKINNYPKII